MPDGRTVAVKTFDSKQAGTLEANVLREISKSPHPNIVEFLNFGLGDEPYLVMGLASGGNLEQQHKLRPFIVQEIALILRQMLNALCYLHDTFGISHRDVKPQNILCDDRSHYRLADFGLAKKGNILATFKGTKPYMAPEIFTDNSYTAVVDIWSLGMVIARYLSGGRGGGFTGGDEGPRWCAAVVAHFERYAKRAEATNDKDPERKHLNFLVGQHMLKIKPEERKSASGCIKLLDRDSNDGSNTIRQGHENGTFSNRLPLDDAKEQSKDVGLPEKHEPLEEEEPTETHEPLEEEELTETHEPLEEKDLGSEGQTVLEGENNEHLGARDPAEGVDTEAVTREQGLNTEQWASLERFLSIERKYALNGNGQESVPQQFIDGNFIDDPQNMLEHSAATADSDGQSGIEFSQGEQGASPAAPPGVPNKPQKRKRSSQ